MDSMVFLHPDRTTETTLPDVKLLAIEYSTLDYDFVYEGEHGHIILNIDAKMDTSIENCCC
jgi:hypothetical protein